MRTRSASSLIAAMPKISYRGIHAAGEVSRNHRRRENRFRATAPARRTISRESVARACVCACMRVNLNKSYMSFPHTRITQPVVRASARIHSCARIGMNAA